MEQLNLNFSDRSACLKAFFEKAAGTAVSVTFTDNISRMLSVRKKAESYELRLNWIFLEADDAVVEEIAGFIRRRKSPIPAIRRFLRERRAVIKSPRKVKRQAVGRYHDLSRLYLSINEEYFGGTVDALITWGRGGQRRVRKRTLGSYNYLTGLIRINGILDKKEVPDYFVSFIVYHEMLHAHLGVKENGARISIHSKEFRTQEKLFKDYSRACAWEKDNRNAL
ncbi:MAG: hypothetical protein HY954_01880 [Deltaproteobacteria bacterium]|nr:hypothetical protein [Deltaproteobacteria bacterium]